MKTKNYITAYLVVLVCFLHFGDAFAESKDIGEFKFILTVLKFEKKMTINGY